MHDVADIYRLALTSLSDTVAITDEDEKITFVCPNVSTIFGYSSEEVLAMQELRNLVGDVPFDVADLDAQSEVSNIDITVSDRSGAEHALLVNVKRVNVGGGTRLYSFHDVTDRRRAEQVARDAIAIKERLFSIIAHDMRNPVSALTAFSELLHMNFDAYGDAKKKECVSSIASCSSHMQTLLENLLTWAQVQDDKLECRPERCDPAMVCAEAVKPSDMAAQSKGVTVRVEIGRNQLVRADRDMLALVLRNLISNAVKFSHPGETVRVSCSDAGDFREICVADEGIGFNESNVARAFASAAGQSEKGTSGEQGTGLGLLLSKEFVELNGGEIRAEKQDKGSKFLFTVPKWHESAAAFTDTGS